MKAAMATMGQKHARKARKIIRGWQQQEPMFHGTDALHEKKLQNEMARMILRDHIKLTNKDLPKEQAEAMVYRFMDADGNEWTERGV